MAKKHDHQALLYACIQEGCPLCRQVQESVKRYLETWKYELFTDSEIRTELRRTQGFCHVHTWQLVKMGASLPLAQAYQEIISDSIEQIQQGNTLANGRIRRFFFETKRDRPDCSACLQKEQAEARYAHTLRQALLDNEFYQQFSASHGLCLEHFRITCTLKATDTPGNWLPLLQRAQLDCLQRLDKQLSEMIRKHDYHFKDEERGAEMISWKRAAGIIAGEEIRG